MISCKTAKKLIDQAEKPDLLAFEVTGHIERCRDCERFANERAGLRKLLASGIRVSAPVNFDAALSARLAEVKARRSVWWLSAPGYLKLGAATAVLAVMIFAAQYAGLFSRQTERTSQPQPMATVHPPAIPLVKTPDVNVSSTTNEQGGNSAAQPVNNIKRREFVLGRRTAPPAVLSAEDGGVVIVRGQNGEMDIQVPTVSVGAQPLLLVGAGRRTTPGTGTSF